jgi:hypothetical protein
MTTETAPVPEADTPRTRYGWASIAVAIVFGLLNAYVLWNAIGNLITLPKEFGSVTPWWLLILDVAAPVVFYVVAFVLGRRRSLGARAILFLLALAVVACSTVGSIAYVQSHFGLI